MVVRCTGRDKMNDGILDAETIVSYHISKLRARQGHFLSNLGGFEKIDIDDLDDEIDDSVVNGGELGLVNGVNEHDIQDDNVTLVNGNRSSRPRFSITNKVSPENKVNKLTATKSKSTNIVKRNMSNQENGANNSPTEIIYLSSSDDEDEGKFKITTVKSINSSRNHDGTGPMKERVIKKVESDGFIIYISDEEEVSVQNTIVNQKSNEVVSVKNVNGSKKPNTKSKTSKLKKVEWESDSSSSSRSPSPTGSLSDSFELDDSNDQIILLLNDYSSSDEDDYEELGIELEEKDVYESFTLKLENDDENMNEINERNESNHTEHSNSVRRTNRRRHAAKATCPCCIGSDTSKKKEHVMKDKHDLLVNQATKKRKLEPSVPVHKIDKKINDKTTGLKMISEMVPKIDEKTNVQCYCCPLCSYTHEEKSELIGHWRAQHAVFVGFEKDIYSFLEPLKKNTRCATCVKMTGEYNNVKRHVLWHNKSNKPFDDCLLCSMLFNKLKLHMFNHEPYRCRLCEKGFTNDIALNNHLITHLYEINEGPSSVKCCKLCKKTFNSIYDNILEHLISHHLDFNIVTTDDLIKHKVKISVRDVNAYKSTRMKNQNGDKQDLKYICLHCTLTFDLVHSFVRHLQLNHKSDHQCKICSSQFETYRELQTHTKIQHQDANERFDCPACKKSFTDVMAFRNHFRVHSEHEMDNYSCPVCSNVLYNLYSLKRHLLIHTGEKPYQCDKCDLRFRDKRNLHSHVKVIHQVNQKKSCNVCELEFSCEYNLKRHMKRSHCSIA